VTDDFYHLREPELAVLVASLQKHGAKLVQLRRITEAVKSLSHALSQPDAIGNAEVEGGEFAARADDGKERSDKSVGGGSNGGSSQESSLAWTPRGDAAGGRPASLRTQDEDGPAALATAAAAADETLVAPPPLLRPTRGLRHSPEEESPALPGNSGRQDGNGAENQNGQQTVRSLAPAAEARSHSGEEGCGSFGSTGGSRSRPTGTILSSFDRAAEEVGAPPEGGSEGFLSARTTATAAGAAACEAAARPRSRVRKAPPPPRGRAARSNRPTPERDAGPGCLNGSHEVCRSRATPFSAHTACS
jgi:hypothetical protein